MHGLRAQACTPISVSTLRLPRPAYNNSPRDKQTITIYYWQTCTPSRPCNVIASSAMKATMKRLLGGVIVVPALAQPIAGLEAKPHGATVTGTDRRHVQDAAGLEAARLPRFAATLANCPIGVVVVPALDAFPIPSAPTLGPPHVARNAPAPELEPVGVGQEIGWWGARRLGRQRWARGWRPHRGWRPRLPCSTAGLRPGLQYHLGPSRAPTPRFLLLPHVRTRRRRRCRPPHTRTR